MKSDSTSFLSFDITFDETKTKLVFEGEDTLSYQLKGVVEQYWFDESEVLPYDEMYSYNVSTQDNIKITDFLQESCRNSFYRQSMQPVTTPSETELLFYLKLAEEALCESHVLAFSSRLSGKINELWDLPRLLLFTNTLILQPGETRIFTDNRVISFGYDKKTVKNRNEIFCTVLTEPIKTWGSETQANFTLSLEEKPLKVTGNLSEKETNLVYKGVYDSTSNENIHMGAVYLHSPTGTDGKSVSLLWAIALVFPIPVAMLIALLIFVVNRRRKP